MAEPTETRIIVIAPSSEITPDQLSRFIHGLDTEVNVKETCYGAMIEGKRKEVDKTMVEVRKLDPRRIFSKIRGFPIGDERRCRAHHGSRPGFAQLEIEWKTLSLIEKGLEAAEKKEEPPPKGKKQRMPVKELQKIVSEVSK